MWKRDQWKVSHKPKGPLETCPSNSACNMQQRSEEEKDKVKTRHKSDEGSSRTQLKLSEACSLRGSTQYTKESQYRSVMCKLVTFVAVANVPNKIADSEDFR